MNKALFIPPILIFSVVAGGVTLDRQREKQRSLLSGVFESQPTLVAARAEGRVGKISSPEGTLVKSGDLLLTLDAKPGQSDAAALESKVREARAHYQELKAGPRREDIRRQEATVAELRAALERLENGNRPAEIATAKARWVQAEAAYRKAVNGPRRQDVQRLQAAADQASFREKFARSDLEKLRKLYAEDEISRQTLEKAETDFQASQAAYREAERNHRSLELGTRVEDVAAARADAEAARQQYLLLAEGSRREDVDAARARLEQGLAQLQELRNGNRIEDIDQSRAAFESARSSAESARLRVRENLVVAPLAGQVERVLVSQGDLVAPNTPLVRISDPEDIWLRVYLPAQQLAKVKVGDAAEIAVDGGVDVSGKVDTIATQGEFTPANLQTPEDRGKQVFAVRLRLAKPDPRVKAGMSATVRRVGQWP